MLVLFLNIEAKSKNKTWENYLSGGVTYSRVTIFGDGLCHTAVPTVRTLHLLP